MDTVASPEVQLVDDDPERDNFSLIDGDAQAQNPTRSPPDGGASLDDSTQGSLTGRTGVAMGSKISGSFAGIVAERRAIAATRKVMKDAMRQLAPKDPFRKVNRGLSAIVAKHRAMLGILTPVSSHSSLVTMAFSEDLPDHAGTPAWTPPRGYRAALVTSSLNTPVRARKTTDPQAPTVSTLSPRLRAMHRWIRRTKPRRARCGAFL